MHICLVTELLFEIVGLRKNICTKKQNSAPQQNMQLAYMFAQDFWKRANVLNACALRILNIWKMFWYTITTGLRGSCYVSRLIWLFAVWNVLIRSHLLSLLLFYSFIGHFAAAIDAEGWKSNTYKYTALKHLTGSLFSKKPVRCEIIFQ